MNLPAGLPILETLATLPDEDAARCWSILERHERVGAERAAVMPGVEHCLDQLARRGLRTAVVTRNSRGRRKERCCGSNTASIRCCPAKTGR